MNLCGMIVAGYMPKRCDSGSCIMTTENLAVMQGLTKKMDWLENRQKVVAQNIANADTPGYRPHDIAPLDFKDLLGSSASKLSISAGNGAGAGSISAPGLATTNSAHMALGGGSAGDAKLVEKESKNPYETSPAGNAVILEEQLQKMGENYADHRLMSNIYQKNIDMMKLSLRSQ
jgi:flagellar basal-body rod protein FlgB